MIIFYESAPKYHSKTYVGILPWQTNKILIISLKPSISAVLVAQVERQVGRQRKNQRYLLAIYLQ